MLMINSANMTLDGTLGMATPETSAVPQTAFDTNTPESGSEDLNSVEQRKKKGRRLKGGRVAAEITKDEIQSLFYLNAEDAAAHLGVGLTALKNICRNNDIPRWPFRRLKRIEQTACKILGGKSAPADMAQLANAVKDLGVAWSNPLWKQLSVDVRTALPASFSPVMDGAASQPSRGAQQWTPNVSDGWGGPTKSSGTNPLRTPSMGMPPQMPGGFTSMPSGDVTASPFAAAGPGAGPEMPGAITPGGPSPASSLPHALSQQDTRASPMLRAWTSAIRREDSFLGSYLSPASSGIPQDMPYAGPPVSRHLPTAASVPVTPYAAAPPHLWRPVDGEGGALGGTPPLQARLPPRSPLVPGQPRQGGIASLSLPPDIRKDYERVQFMYQAMQQDQLRENKRLVNAVEADCIKLNHFRNQQLGGGHMVPTAAVHRSMQGLQLNSPNMTVAFVPPPADAFTTPFTAARSASAMAHPQSAQPWIPSPDDLEIKGSMDSIGNVSLRPSDDSFIKMLDMALGPRGSSGHRLGSGGDGHVGGAGNHQAMLSAGPALNDPMRCNSPPLNMASLWADDDAAQNVA